MSNGGVISPLEARVRELERQLSQMGEHVTADSFAPINYTVNPDGSVVLPLSGMGIRDGQGTQLPQRSNLKLSGIHDTNNFPTPLTDNPGGDETIWGTSTTSGGTGVPINGWGGAINLSAFHTTKLCWVTYDGFSGAVPNAVIGDNPNFNGFITNLAVNAVAQSITNPGNTYVVTLSSFGGANNTGRYSLDRVPAANERVIFNFYYKANF